MLSGYFHFGNNHFLLQFSFIKNILQMFAYGRNTNTKQLCHSLLGTPDGFVFYDDLNLPLFIGKAI